MFRHQAFSIKGQTIVLCCSETKNKATATTVKHQKPTKPIKPIKNNLKHAGFDEDLLGESKAWDGHKKFNLVKDHAALLPSNLTHLRVGLGWDTRLDIDASVILYKKDGTYSDTIYFGKLQTPNKSIVHQGDNLTGEGDGDDEVIDIELGLIP